MSPINLSEYTELFISTAMDHILSSRDLLLSSSLSQSETLREVYRRMHSLKGSSSVMGYSSIQEVSQHIVDLIHENEELSDSIKDSILISLKKLEEDIKKIGPTA